MVLTDAARKLGFIVKESLELWLQVADELPYRTRHPHTAAAAELVQAALQEAPWPMQLMDSRQVEWLQKHLPGISTAMQRSVSSQLDIFVRRISILQSLARNRTPSDAQPLACLQSELNTRMLLNVLSYVLSIVLPVEALCCDLSWQVNPRGTAHARFFGVSKQQYLMQQGDALISFVGSNLVCSANTLAELSEKLQQTSAQVEDVKQQVQAGPKAGDMSDDDPQDDVHKQLLRAGMLLGKASSVWLHLVSGLPPTHNALMYFLEQVDWNQLSFYRDSNHRADSILKPMLRKILSNGHLLALIGQQHPELARCLLQYTGTADRVRTAGLSPTELQQVQTILQKADSDTHTGPMEDVSYASLWLDAADSDSVTDSTQRAMGYSVGSAGADTSCTTGAEGDLNDMQALLHMMYGCTVKEDSVKM